MLVHGDNLTQKENNKEKYTDNESKQYLKEIRAKYDKWKFANETLKGPLSILSKKDKKIIQKRVQLFSDYKEFIDQQKYAEKFDSRSNLHSSVLEEFIYYIFRDLVFEFSESAVLGKAHTFKDVFFNSSSYKEMVSKPNAKIERKDHDFIIGVNIVTKMNCEGSDVIEEHNWQIPAVAIECKTYLDKTMLEGSSTAAEQLKHRNPNAIYIVVSEWLKLTEQVNLKKFKVDQIYILRKQKNTDREYRYAKTYKKNPIYDDVVEHLFVTVRQHLTSEWEGGISFGLKKGYLL
ncbi:MAG: restriction endonuclease [Bacteroidetes bacterium CG18_big_fil_WC_8_21_14_2_50_41_14]|nr:MAG: restriction endonuclease [Bacteroidetes bacterium CG18_big_fil_WC_8_21_14_2_50_41_14]PJB58774.1 MAG: Bpu10I family restriction endonuclease [Bacteroidetes bacterium CG_4_9_14_3_um_filter_41_19]